MVSGALAAITLCLVLQQGTQVVAGASTAEQAPPGQAYVFRFDPQAESFESFAIPTVGANPHSVKVVPGTGSLNVWFTEPGADQIGRLIYTNTANSVLREYSVTVGSMPLDLVVDGDGNHVWFTAHRGNWIGRWAVSNGELITFPVPTANSQPAGIDLAPDGSIWFTEMAADKVGRLIVTGTMVYEFKEYPINDTSVGAYDIAVQTDRYVWFSETRTGNIKRLKVADGSFSAITPLSANGYPYALVWDTGRSYLWFTERDSNQISQIQLTTLTILNSYPITPSPNSRPTGLTLLGSNQFWFSGQGSGQIGRMVYTSPIEYNFKFFDLPISGLWAMDIAAAPDGRLWTVAYLPRHVFLPLMMRS